MWKVRVKASQVNLDQTSYPYRPEVPVMSWFVPVLLNINKLCLFVCLSVSLFVCFMFVCLCVWEMSLFVQRLSWACVLLLNIHKFNWESFLCSNVLPPPTLNSTSSSSSSSCCCTQERCLNIYWPKVYDNSFSASGAFGCYLLGVRIKNFTCTLHLWL